MPISVQCQCGQTMQAPDSMAGKRGKCPKCNQQFVVPGGQVAGAKPATKQKAVRAKAPTATATKTASEADSMASLLDEVGMQKARTRHNCPECRADIDEDAVICIHCGMNLETGVPVKQKLHGSVGGGKKAADKPDEPKPSIFDDPKVKYGTLGIVAVIALIAVYIAVQKFL